MSLNEARNGVADEEAYALAACLGVLLCEGGVGGKDASVGEDDDVFRFQNLNDVGEAGDEDAWEKAGAEVGVRGEGL